MNTTQITDRKREILQTRLQTKIEDGLASSRQYLEKIETEGKLLNDFILPVGYGKQINFSAAPLTTPDNLIYDGTDRVMMEIVNGNSTEYSLHPNAVMQAAEKLGAPATYLRDLAQSRSPWKTKLAAKILNEHTAHSGRQRVLVREINGEIRAILSDMYRRLNGQHIYESFIASSKNAGALISSAYADDLKGWIETLYPQVIDVPTQKNGIIPMAFGMRLSTSDFGDGALTLQSFRMNVQCLNGMVGQNVMRQIHLGSRIPDDIKLSERTYHWDTKTQASLVGDAVAQLMSPNYFAKAAYQIQGASEIEVNLEEEFKKLPKMGFNKSEIEEAKVIVTNNKEEDGVTGQNTLWKLVQATTAVARTKDGRRQRELQDLSAKLMERVRVS